MAASESATIVREQNLALRVMRLSNPQFYGAICLGRDVADPFSMAIYDSVAKLGGQRSVDLPLDSHLIAPHAMSDVYLGETFTLYISIINISAFICKEIVIKVDIQTQNQRIALGEMAFIGIAVEPNQQIGKIFKHDIRELGQHILVCAVTYRNIGMENPTEELMNLRKFFKFSVTNPLDIVSHKLLHGIKGFETLFEVLLKNLCTTPIIIEHISLPNAAGVKTMSRRITDSLVLSPKALRRYLFTLDNLQPHQKSFGPMEIRWRTTMGERGQIRWETVAPPTMALNFGVLRLSLIENPKRVRLNEAFTAEFQLQNKSDRSLDLLLTLVSAAASSLSSALPCTESSAEHGQQRASLPAPQFGPFIHCSLSGHRLPLILPNNTLNLALKLLPIVPGLQTISGIRLTDTVSKRTYEFDEVAKLFVYH